MNTALTCVWPKLKESNPSLITNHCKDHVLALACRDSYNNVKEVKHVDETLDNSHKLNSLSATTEIGRSRIHYKTLYMLNLLVASNVLINCVTMCLPISSVLKIEK